MTDETQLSEELSRRAHGVHGATLTLDDVRGKARSIRRRRTTGAVVAAAAVVAAIIIPLSLSGSAGKGSAPEPAPSGPTHAVDPLESGLPTLQGDAIVYPDGRRIELQLPGMTPDGFAVLGTDRHVVTVQTDDGGRAVAVVDESGEMVASGSIEGGLAASPDAQAVAWMGPDGGPMLLTADADQPDELPAVEGTEPTAVAITGDCADVCTVTVATKGDGLGPSWQVDTRGNVTRAPIPTVLDVSQAGGQLAGLDSYGPDEIGACGGVFNVGTDDFLWHDCPDNVYDLSPGGEQVATTLGEGLGPTGVTIRDAQSGTVVAELRDQGWVSSFAWEGEQLLVVVVAEDGATSLKRLSSDGVETVEDGFTSDMDMLRPAVILPTVG